MLLHLLDSSSSATATTTRANRKSERSASGRSDVDRTVRFVVLGLVRSLQDQDGLPEGDLPDRFEPANVEWLLGSASGEDGGVLGNGGLQVERVGEVEPPCTRLVPAKETWVCSIAKCGPSAARRPLGVGCSGHEPSDRVGDQPVDLGGTDPVRERGDVASTNAAAAG